MTIYIYRSLTYLHGSKMSHTSSPEIFPRQCCPTQRISASWDCEKFVSENCTKILVTFIVVEYESSFEFPLRNGWTCAGYKWDEYEPSLQKKGNHFWGCGELAFGMLNRHLEPSGRVSFKFKRQHFTHCGEQIVNKSWTNMTERFHCMITHMSHTVFHHISRMVSREVVIVRTWDFYTISQVKGIASKWF